MGDVLEQVSLVLHTTKDVVLHFQFIEFHRVGRFFSPMRHELASSRGDGDIVVVEDNVTLAGELLQEEILVPVDADF